MRTAQSRKASAGRLLRSTWSFSALVDQGFFIFAGLASFWLAWLVLRDGLHSGVWWMVAVFVIVWAITSYLALPRLHRILTSIYVPNYFIGRARTADGLLGDPVNLAVRGSERQIHKVMTDAGWTLADEITLRSSWRMIIATIMRRSYVNAPVSSLFLFGRRQDFAYQQEIDGSPGKRHHVRFWHCPKGWLLPGGHRVDWLAAGTYDKSVGLSLLTFQVTHKIDENTDIERDYIIKTITDHTKSVQVLLLKDFSTGYHARNGGGDSIRTDGDLPVLELKGIRAASAEELVQRTGLIFDTTIHDRRPIGYEATLSDVWSRRPVQIVIGAILMVVVIIQGGMDLVYNVFHWQHAIHDPSFQGDIVTSTTGLLVASVLEIVVFLIELFLVVMVLRGSNRARISLLVISSLMVLSATSAATIGKMNFVMLYTLALIGAHIIIVLLFSSDEARRFTKTRTQLARLARHTKTH